MNFFLLYVSYSILGLYNLKYFVLQQKLVLVSSVALVISYTSILYTYVLMFAYLISLHHIRLSSYVLVFIGNC